MQTQHVLATETCAGQAASDSLAMTSSTISIENDGSILALASSGLSDTGSTAAIAAIVAEELRISIDRISIESTDAVTATADELPMSAAVALRSTAVAVRAYLLRQASSYFDMDASELMLNDGRVITLDGREMPYQDLIRARAARCVSSRH